MNRRAFLQSACGLMVPASILSKPVAAFGIMASGSRYFAAAGSGAIADGDTIVRTGPSATKPSIIEWLGGSGGVIDSATADADFSRTGWSKSFTDISRWTYNTGRTFNRSKSLLADNKYPTPTDGRKTWFYDYGASGVTEEYRSCNFYCDRGSATTFQWKIWRLLPAELETDGQDPSWYIANWYNGYGNAFLNVYNQDGGGTRDLSTLAPFNGWFRLEVFWTCNTPNGTSNGTIRFKCTNRSTGATVFDDTFSSVNFRGSTGPPPVHRYACWQNYLGNETPTDTQLRVYMDDIYMSAVASSTGAFVRAELCNNGTYASATISEICEVTGISGTDWSVKLNKGQHASSDLTGLYLALFPASGSPTMVAV